MKGILGTLLLLLLGIKVSAQDHSFNKLINVLESGRISELNTYLTTIREESNCDADIYGSTSWETANEIVPRHYEGVISFVSCKDSNGKVNMNSRTVKILFKDSTIYYYAFSYPGERVNLASQKLNKTMYSELTVDFLKVYVNATLTLDNFLQ